MCADDDATKCESSCWRRCEDWRPTLLSALLCGGRGRRYPPSHPPPRPELPFSLAQHNSLRLGDLSGDPARVVGLLTWVSPRIAARLLVSAIVLALDAAQQLWNKRAIARLAPLIRPVRTPTGPKVPPAISTAPPHARRVKYHLVPHKNRPSWASARLSSAHRPPGQILPCSRT